MEVKTRRYLAAKGCWELRLEDGRSFWAAEAEDWLDGDLTEAQIDRLAEASDYLHAKDYCLRALGRREHFSKELRDKLTQRGIPPNAIGRVLRELRSDGHLDDMRAAKSFVREKTSSGMNGARKIVSELAKRGMALDEARRLVAEAATPEYEAAQIAKFTRKNAAGYRERMQRELDRTLADEEKVKKAGGARGVEYKLKMKYLDKIRAKLVAAGFTGEAASNAARSIISGD